jgi:hypothetical protein
MQPELRDGLSRTLRWRGEIADYLTIESIVIIDIVMILGHGIDRGQYFCVLRAAEHRLCGAAELVWLRWSAVDPIGAARQFFAITAFPATAW